MSEDSPRIINLAGQPVATLTGREEWCRHGCEHISVDAHTRTLTCRTCGKAVEPFDWVHRMANREGCLIQSMLYRRQELAKIDEALLNLKAEEKRVKSRIRAAKDSLLRAAGA